MVVSGVVKEGEQEKPKGTGRGVVLLNLNTANSRAKAVGIVHGADTLRKPFLLQAAWGSKPGTCPIFSPNPLPQPLFRRSSSAVGVSLLSTQAATTATGDFCWPVDFC